MTNKLSQETLSIDMDEKPFNREQLKEVFNEILLHPLKHGEYCTCRAPNQVPYHIGGVCIQCHKRVNNHAIR